jgi:hypothetical protein
MYYSYVEIEYVATSFSPARTDLALKLLIREKPAEYLNTGYHCKYGLLPSIKHNIHENVETFIRIVWLYLGVYLQLVSLF